MLKILLKKEISRLLASLSGQTSAKKKQSKLHKKTNSNKKKSGAGMIILWAFILFSVFMAFLGISASLSGLLTLGLDWLFYAILGIMAFVVSLVGNAFTASSVLFKAKDNEMLLSLPIKPRDILLSRTLLIYILCVLFSMVVFVPAMLTRFMNTGFSLVQLISGLVIILFMALMVAAISALLGWLLAILSKHIKNKSIATAIFTFIFLGAYYYVYFNMQKYLTKLSEASTQIGETIKTNIFAWPILQMGKAAAGDFKALVMYAVLCLVIFVIVYYILSKRFIRIATASEKTVSVKYEAAKQAEVAMNTPVKALMKREMKHFLGSPVYMVNELFGAIILIGLSVILLVNKSLLTNLLDKLVQVLPVLSDYLPLTILAATIMLAGTVCTTAPSISIEGKTMWIIKTMPVKTLDVLSAKLRFGLWVAFPPAAIFIVVSGLVLGFEFSYTIFNMMAAYMFISLNLLFGLVGDLKNPKLDWSNEAQPVKQNAIVLLCFFLGLLVDALFVGVFILFKNYLDASKLLIAIIVVLGLCVRFMNEYVKRQGKKLFDDIQA